MVNKQCGLEYSHSLTVPLRTTFFPVSNDAAPWCANNGADIAIPMARTTKTTNLLLIAPPFRQRRYSRVIGLLTMTTAWCRTAIGVSILQSFRHLLSAR